MRTDKLEPTYVEFIPDKMEAGKLYISKTYGTANHLCACGCRQQTVTPIRGDGKMWNLTDRNGFITLDPSIENKECGAHYFIKDNLVVFA